MLYTSKNTSNMVGPTLMAATRGLVVEAYWIYVFCKAVMQTRGKELQHYLCSEIDIKDWLSVRTKTASEGTKE